MQRLLFVVMAVAVAVTFNASVFAGEKNEVKKGNKVVMFIGDEEKKKEEK